VADAPFIVRFLTESGKTAGLGTLTGSRHVITCAHVVNAALGREQLAQDRPDRPVTIEFLRLPGQPRFTGQVQNWRPPPRGDAREDNIAELVLDDDPPAAAKPARLATEPARVSLPVRVFGCPSERAGGIWARATVGGVVGDGLIQLDASPESSALIRPGFSGSPVCEADNDRVVGIVVSAAERDSYAISADRIRDAQQGPLPGSGPHHPDSVTILHVSGIRSISSADSSESAGSSSGLVDADLADLDFADLAERHGLRPDLIVATGDLASQGLASEVRRATWFLGELAEAAEIPRRHVAIVPGNHDVNRKACAAYFSMEEAREKEPVFPYYAKWQQYADALTRFYGSPGDSISFTPVTPFMLFEMPDLNVVVAGLNSTINDSHLEPDHHGFLGRPQLDWFAGKLGEYRRRGWLRVAAVHDGAPKDSAYLDRRLGAAGLAHLLLHDGTPGPRPGHLPSGVIALSTGAARYQLVTVRPGSVSRYVRRYQAYEPDWHDRATCRLTGVHEVFPRAEADAEPEAGPLGDPGTTAESPVPPEAPWPDEFLDRVAEATRVRFPGSTVANCFVEDVRYLRVCTARDEGGIEERTIGVTDGPPSTETISAFAGKVHARFASSDPFVRSELVYDAPAADSGLVRYARELGVRLRSMVEYQGLLDLTRLTGAQRERLEDDELYPADLYVEQRYRIAHGAGHSDEIQTELVAQAADWMGAEDARLVVVLGDSGRGKTAFLRQLTRTLPDLVPDVIPILIELRTLEKGPTLNDLLGQHLIRQGIEDFNPRKLRYMVNSGRVALLFDGLDELELRVGYETAAGYLKKLVSSVSDESQAKVILTSRTQHFRSVSQVGTVLGQNLEGRPTSRVVVLEEFSNEQMTEFLTLLYEGDAKRARERLELFRGIGNLIDLAHNPRILSSIARLDSGRLRAALDESDRISAAGVYKQIIAFWLEYETDRQRHEHGRPTITQAERFSACTALALRLWQSGDPELTLADLTSEVTATLPALKERGFTDEQAGHAIAAGTLFVRTEDETFAFIHQSFMEWLVANAALGDLTILSRALLSPLMAAFLTGLPGASAATDWARRVLADSAAPDVARNNAYTLVGERPPSVPRPNRIHLSGLDLRGRDLTGQDLTRGDLSRATLRGMRLDDVNLTGADLSHADLTGVTMTGGSLRGATLAGSTWDHAAILGTDGLDTAQAPELEAAAIPGRDRAKAMFVPPGECRGAAMSADGTLLAVVRGRTALLIDVASGIVLRVLHGHSRQVTGVAFSADGALLATASRDGTARIWDVLTGARRSTLTGHGDWVTAVAFSPAQDSTLVATASRDGAARTWDAATGQAAVTFAGHDEPVGALAFSGDGTLLATGSGDATARVWNAADGTLLTAFTGHRRAVTAVAFSPEGTLLATGSEDRTVRLGDAAAGGSRRIASYPESVSAIAFSADGSMLATAHGSEAEILDPARGTSRTTLRGHHRPVAAIAFSPDGTTLATTSEEGPHLWDLDSGVRRTVTMRPAAPVTAVAFSRDGTLLATGDRDGAVRAWDARAGTRRGPFDDALSQQVTAAAFSPDGSLLATAAGDNLIRIWTMASGALQSRQRQESLAAVTFSPEGGALTAVSFGGDVRTSSVGSQAGVIAGYVGAARALAFSADGRFLAAVPDDEASASVYAVPSGTPLASVAIGELGGQVSSVAYCPGSGPGQGLLAVGSSLGIAGVWDVSSRSRIATLEGHTHRVNSIVFSPDGGVIVTGSDDGTARAWNAVTGEDRAVFAGHADRVRAVACSADGSLVATGSSDGTARLWDAGSGREIAAFVSLPDGGYATLLPGGGYRLGHSADDIWWALKLRRFGPGALDSHDPDLRRLGPEETIG